jgi:uncharacterized protein YdhG (YjbR/CyaY superfamily)
VGNPFLVEPRFLFAFSAHKGHRNFAPTAAGLARFRKEPEMQKTTKRALQVPYNKSLPEDLVHKIARYRPRDVRDRADRVTPLAHARTARLSVAADHER